MVSISLNRTPVFHASTLPSKCAGRAFPLVRLANPSADPLEWKQYVRTISKKSRNVGGLTVIEDGRGYVHCLFSWRVLPQINYRTALRISDFIIASLPGRAIHDAVLTEFRNIADATGADAIVVEASDNVGCLRWDALLASGFWPVSERFNLVRLTSCRA